MKKVFGYVLVMMFLMFNGISASAAGLDDWTNLSGFEVNGKLAPAELKMTGNGLQYYSADGYYKGDGKYSAVIYNTPVDAGNFSVEFTIDKVAGSYADGVDSWISLCLLNQKEYFTVGDPQKSQGLVSLLIPGGNKISINTFQHVLTFAHNGAQEFERDPLGTYSIEFKKNNDGTYSYFYNGTEMDAVFDAFDGVFSDGKAYFMMGASTNNGKPIQFTITKINGKPVEEKKEAPAETKALEKTETTDKIDKAAETKTTAETKKDTAVKTEESTNPATGDASAFVYAAMLVSASSGLFLLKKTANKKN